MARRGDVFRLKRQLGFGTKGLPGSVVILQDDRLNTLLSTTLAAPLDVATSIYQDDDTAVPVSGAEAGAERAHVVLTTHLVCLPQDRLETAAVGRLNEDTLADVDEMLGFVLGVAPSP